MTGLLSLLATGALVALGVWLLGGIVLGVFGAPAQAGAPNRGREFYLALGGSGSVGVQPTRAAVRGQPTDRGYSNDLLGLLRSRWSDLQLVELGCPGETSATTLNGEDKCRSHRRSSQLAEALSFLERHRSTVLVTVDLGFNNLRPCLARGRVDGQIDEGCVDQSLATVKQQLAEILNQLRAAGPPDMDVVGIGHYDPLLADYLRGGAPRTFALQSLDVISRLNDTLRSTYMDAGVPMADVAAVFDLPDRGAVTVSGLGNVPEDVARTCALTWMCNPPPLGPNPHPDDAGYEAIARAVSAVVPSG